MIQQWRPWEKATGPKSPEGKAAASQNAYKGVFRPMMNELTLYLAEQRRFSSDLHTALDRRNENG
jgi:hypothetical protein